MFGNHVNVETGQVFQRGSQVSHIEQVGVGCEPNEQVDVAAGHVLASRDGAEHVHMGRSVPVRHGENGVSVLGEHLGWPGLGNGTEPLEHRRRERALSALVGGDVRLRYSGSCGQLILCQASRKPQDAYLAHRR